jgi:hypothetical protein
MKSYALLLTLLTLLTLCSTTMAPAQTPFAGTFALQGATPRAAAYLVAPQIGKNPLYRRLDTWMTPIGSSTAIRSYQIDMTKYLHMIAISDDLRTFLHIHPMLGADGHFLLDQAFPTPALYHIYIDARPEKLGQQVFRFDVDLGQPRGLPKRDLSQSGTVSTAGPYTVSISSNSLSTQSESRVVVHVLRNGTPASDLHPYLGALAHAVFINSDDLSYVHAHPLPLLAPGANGGSTVATNSGDKAMPPPLPSTMVSSPNMLLHVALREPGTYKLWLQFRGGSELYVAPFVLTAR